MSDLIRRQDAIDAMYQLEAEDIEAYGCFITEGFHANQAVEALEALPSAEPERRWIPVTEALPEDDTDVLVQFSNNMAVGYYKYSRWGIATGADLYCRIEDYEEKPIAWMPLPEVYGGKNE